MSNDRYTDKQLALEYGRRPVGAFIFLPQELGWRCPKGHADIAWSEFVDHLWCYVCKQDYHSLDDCFLVKDKLNPGNLPKKPRIISTVKNWDKTGNYNPDVPKKHLPKEER